jgi:hypothetical protein
LLWVVTNIIFLDAHVLELGFQSFLSVAAFFQPERPPLLFTTCNALIFLYRFPSFLGSFDEFFWHGLPSGNTAFRSNSFSLFSILLNRPIAIE